MALSERPQPSLTHKTPDKGKEKNVAPKPSKLKRYIAVPVALSIALAGGGYVVYEEAPPVHRAVDNTYHDTLNLLGLETGQHKPNITNAENITGQEVK